MTIDMTNNRVLYGLLTDEEKAALHEHEKAGGAFEVTFHGKFWEETTQLHHFNDCIYRTLPLPKTQDVIAWEKLPEWVEWVARDEDGKVFCSADEQKCDASKWLYSRHTLCRRIDDFPGIVQIGTVDWEDSKQRRPR
jgi:hypothetical protein